MWKGETRETFQALGMPDHRSQMIILIIQMKSDDQPDDQELGFYNPFC
jgi:hypothetical protein